MEKKKTPFNTLDKMKSDEKIANAISPLNLGQINEGVENIKVRILDWPDEKRMKVLLSKMVQATIGGNIEEEINEELGEELFKGGLQTGLEAFNVSFEISGVSRAFTHQFVRTRKAAYHQQSSRYTFMGDAFNVRMPQTIADNPEAKAVFENFVKASRETYTKLCQLGTPFQDARFTCPVGLETYIIGEFPLKVFMDTYAYRGCYGFQWEIQYVFQEMRKLLVEKLPFLDEHIKISCEKTGKCMFQGWENVEDFCPLPYAKERVFVSKHFGSSNTNKE
jgi:thymidylate synthase (FAD)